MLIMSVSSKMLALMIALIVIWAWQNYKHEQQHNPLIANVIKNQDNHRNISRPWDTLDMARNLQAEQTKQKRKAEKAEKAR